MDTAAVLANMVEQSENDELKTLHSKRRTVLGSKKESCLFNLQNNLRSCAEFDGFWELFSESSLVESFVLSKRAVHLHTRFFREHIDDVSEDILSVSNV